MKKASWIVLAVLGAAILAISLVSAYHAYTVTDDYRVGPLRVSEVAGGDAAVTTALRAIRGTSAAFGAAYGVLFLAIVLGPYRRGEVWAWNALLAAGLTLFVLIALRMPILGTQLGLGAGGTPLVILVIGLLLDVGRLRTNPASGPGRD